MKRNNTIDLLRIILCVLVVLLHTGIDNSITRMAVPCFSSYQVILLQTKVKRK